MNRLIAAIATIGLALPTPLLAEVDQKIHKLCIEAKDYAGCVKAMTTSSEEKTPSLRLIEGERELTGNSCPADFAYSGAGYCTKVICTWEMGGHAQDLGGKTWSCSGGILQKPSLRWGNETVKATSDPSCPPNPPARGWQSSCEEARRYRN